MPKHIINTPLKEREKDEFPAREKNALPRGDRHPLNSVFSLKPSRPEEIAQHFSNEERKSRQL